MTDIVERLRGLDMKRQILSEAADEIERLRDLLMAQDVLTHNAQQQNATLRAQLATMDWEQRRHTIERCAQVAATATITVGDATETRANIVAAIRALTPEK